MLTQKEKSALKHILSKTRFRVGPDGVCDPKDISAIETFMGRRLTRKDIKFYTKPVLHFAVGDTVLRSIHGPGRPRKCNCGTCYLCKYRDYKAQWARDKRKETSNED